MPREIKEQYAIIDRLTQELQGAIMQLRMLPVAEIFDRFPRLVRDLGRRLHKQVELVVEGQDTAADKTIIEALGDPLLHVVRNSLDHGIEPPETRLAAGKAAAATLRLRAFATFGGKRTLYQDAALSAMRSADDLIRRFTGGKDTLAAGTVMFCGTVVAIGGVRPSERFEVELEDPASGDKLTLGYDVDELPVVS